ncbi:hypothetical protein [Pseudoalteromonas piscicida]|uniref:Uncharacterized protein n=1 Tax=Pseudoalteromonas piscicida TaxID=43662 RepID=A0A2A5JQW9_PSEO7|nr:hypothetical protein [Pseudoalteromonas piscicida]PCK31816.1 hypothetical protein CEX98_10565 [Pseudoalteromonas piscicida]
MKFKISNKIWLTMSKVLFVSSLSLPALANTVAGKVTHSISVPNSGYLNSPVNISWSPLPGFSFADFSFVKIGYRLNGGDYTFQDHRGSGTSISLNQTGRWCFIVRGWNSNEGEFGLFNINNEQCVQIRDLPTPSVPAFGSHEYYQPVNKDFVLKWNPQSGGQYVSYYKLNGAYFSGQSKKLNFANYGRQSFSVQACNSQDKCSSAATTGVYIYSSPGFVRNLTSEKVDVELNEAVNITWRPAGGMIPSGYYAISLDGRQLYSGKDLHYTHRSSNPGWHTYKIAACNPSLPCTESYHTINVSGSAEVEGNASFNYEHGSGNKIIDPYYNKNEYLSWNISQIKNANSYQVDVLAEGGSLLGSYNTENVGSNVRFKFGNNINSTNYKTNQSVRVKLKACNRYNQCRYVTDTNSTPTIKLAKWNNNVYYEGTPLHIVAIHAETDSSQQNVYNKLWPRAKVGTAGAAPAKGPHYFYEVDGYELIKAYMFPYAIDDAQGNLKANSGVAAQPETSKVLFDGVVLWNNLGKYDKNTTSVNRLENTFHESDGLIAPLTTVNSRHFWREYLDNVFGVKSELDLVDLNDSKFNTKYLFKPDENGKRVSIFDAIHKTTLDTEAPRGVYLILPAPFIEPGSADSFDYGLHLKRTKYYIDEVIEQYSIFLENVKERGEKTNVRLAGFKWGQESSGMKNESVCKASKTDEACLSAFNDYLREIKRYLNGFTANNPGTTGQLQHLAFVYSTINADFKTHASPGKKFSEFTCEKSEEKVEECFTRFSSIKAGGFVEHFDQVFFQPNATSRRFGNKKSGDMSDEAIDREVLDWYVRGLFNKLPESDASKYSLMIEYIRALGKPIVNNERDFGLLSTDPGHLIHPHFKNFEYPSYRSRLHGETKYTDGFYGDLSYYTDYIMTQFPPEFRQGKRSFLYDDNGGLAYCYSQYARGLKNSCVAGRYIKGDNSQDKFHRWDLVESISDLRSLYSFIEATRSAKKNNGLATKAFQGDNNIFPKEPIIMLTNHDIIPGKVSSKKLDNIAISSGQTISVKSLVRARLLEEVAFKSDITGIKEDDLVRCSAEPRVRVSFYDTNNTLLLEQNVGLTKEQFKYACLTHAMKSAYFEGGRGEERGINPSGHQYAGKRAYGSGFWPDADNWELLKGEFTAPSQAVKASISLEAVSTGLPNNLEAYMFYRPEYIIH